SVIGRSFSLPVLERAHPAFPGAEALVEQLQCFAERDFVQPAEEGLSFTHNTVQEVIYCALPTSQQENLHARVGDAIAALTPGAVQQLAYHYPRAGDPARPQALRYLDLAAQQAQRSYANATALNYYRQALSLETRWEWLKGQAEVLHILGVRDEEAQAITALEAVPAAPRAEVYRLQFQLAERTSEYIGAITAGERLLALSRESGDWLNPAESLRQLGLVHRKQGDNETAQVYYRQAYNLLSCRGELDLAARRVWANLLNNLGWLLFRQSQFDEAKGYLDQALASARALGNRYLEADVLTLLGSCAQARQALHAAREFFTQARDLARAIGSREREALAYLNLARVAQDRGEHSAERENLLLALRLLQATGDRWNEGNVWNGLGVLYQGMGQYAQAAEALEKARQIAISIGDQGGLVYVLINLALVRRDEGRPTEAFPLFAEGLELARQTGDNFMEAAYLSQLGLLSVSQGQYDQARDHAARALSIRHEIGVENIASDNLAVIAKAALGSGEPGQALDYARKAFRLVQDCGAEGPENPVQDLYLSHQVFAALGNHTEARQALDAAHRLMEARAGKIVDPDLRQSYLTRVPLHSRVIEAAKKLAVSP
ncbi:MAG: hypothetical protein EHM70_11460, partial [Chloroflexota bacterium]